MNHGKTGVFVLAGSIVKDWSQSTSLAREKVWQSQALVSLNPR